MNGGAHTVRRSPPDNVLGPLRLHLGCGPIVVAGWENLDKSPNVILARMTPLRKLLHRVGVVSDEQAQGFPPGVKFVDLSRRLPYRDESVDAIYSGHLIEHMSPTNAGAMLAECRRVLRPGGRIRFSTPDLRETIDQYLESVEAGSPDAADEFMKSLGTYTDGTGSRLRRFVNRNVSAFHHQWLYDGASLRQLFERSGFRSVELQAFRDNDFPDLDQMEIRPSGLFIEAVG